MEWLLGLSLRDQVLDGVPPLVLGPFGTSRRPLRTQLATPNSRTSGLLFLRPCTRPSRGPHRSLPVVPSLANEGTTGRLRRGYGGSPVLDQAVSFPVRLRGLGALIMIRQSNVCSPRSQTGPT